MAGWSAAQYQAWIAEAAHAYFSAMRSDLDSDLIDQLGGVFTLAAMDRRRLHSMWNLESTRRQIASDAWKAHRAAIEKRMANTTPDRAVAEYFSAVTGTWPQSKDQLIQANARAKTLRVNDPSVPAWEFDLLVERSALRRKLRKLPGATAGIATVAHFALSSERNWQYSLGYGMDLENLTAPLRAAGTAKGMARGLQYTAPVDTRPQVTLYEKPGVRPPVDTGSTGSRLDTLGNRQTMPGTPRDSQRGTTDPWGAVVRKPAQPTSAGPVWPPVLAKPVQPQQAPAAAAAPKSVLGPQQQAILADKLRNDQGAIRAAEKFFAKYRQVSRDIDTVERFAGYLRVTRGLLTNEGKLRTYLETRAVAGELKALIQLIRLGENVVSKIEIIKPINLPGAVNADLRITLTKPPSPLKVEITTVTGAAQGARTPPREPGTGGKPAAADRPTKTRGIISAVRRKLNSGQAEDGIVIIEVPFGTKSLLPPSARTRIKQLLQAHQAKGGRVREIWISFPGMPRAQYVAGQGLGLTTVFH